MNRLADNTPPSTPTPGQRGDLRETGSIQRSRARKPQTKPAARLKCPLGRPGGTSISMEPEAVFTDVAVRSLIDEWLVPMLVERFVASRLVKQTQEEK
jgi:hypothetical protein